MSFTDGVTVTITIPLCTIGAANSREHWAAKARRVKKEREATRLYARGPLRGLPPPASVELVRISPRLLDEDDNLPMSMKAVRDEVAALFGVDDGPEGPIKWRYAQRKMSKTYAVELVCRW